MLKFLKLINNLINLETFQIHNNEIYKQLCNLWKSKYNYKDNNYFFKYRK